MSESVSAGDYIMPFPDYPGYYCVEIQLIGKANPSTSYGIDSSPLENFMNKKNSLASTVFETKKVIIPTEENCDFDICILSFKANYDFQSDFGFFTARDPAKPISPEIILEKLTN